MTEIHKIMRQNGRLQKTLRQNGGSEQDRSGREARLVNNYI